MLMIQIPAEKAVRVTSEHGGYKTGLCLACQSGGWLDGHGYPHGAEVAGNLLQHRAECPMNEVLNEDGTLKAA